MITETHLKEKLTAIDFTCPDSIKEWDMDALLKEMVHHIGSIDGDLRDTLIYTSLYRLMEGNHLSPEQMFFLFDSCIDESHLFHGIGKKEDDSVFTRSFSSLVMALLLDKDRVKPFLPNEKVREAIEACFQYLEAEVDTRGYVESKGWAHSIAHGADYLTEVIKHPHFSDNLHKRSLEIVKTCIFKDAAYVDNEDGRLCFAVEALVDKGLTDEKLLSWLMDLSSSVNKRYKESGYSLSFYREQMNIEKFKKNCYFRLKWKDAGSKSRDHIDTVLQKWHRHEFN